jgi:hypothetical protein
MRYAMFATDVVKDLFGGSGASVGHVVKPLTDSFFRIRARRDVEQALLHNGRSFPLHRKPTLGCKRGVGGSMAQTAVARTEQPKGKSNPQRKPQIAMSCTAYGYFGSPRGLVSCCKTNKRYPDKGEVGGSSPPRPTICFP